MSGRSRGSKAAVAALLTAAAGLAAGCGGAKPPAFNPGGRIPRPPLRRWRSRAARPG